MNPHATHPAIQYMLEVLPLEWRWMKIEAIENIKKPLYVAQSGMGYARQLAASPEYRPLGRSAHRLMCKAAELAWEAAANGTISQLP